MSMDGVAPKKPVPGAVICGKGAGEGVAVDHHEPDPGQQFLEALADDPDAAADVDDGEDLVEPRDPGDDLQQELRAGIDVEGAEQGMGQGELEVEAREAEFRPLVDEGFDEGVSR
jgi:hypothetical protein